MRTWIVGIIAALGISASCSPSIAMEFSLLPAKGNGKVILATGEIARGDDERLHQFVAGLSGSYEIIGIVLSSPGGNYVEGVRLATSVRNSRITSSVAPDSICASACFLIFAAGTEKTVFEGARLGVHSASDAFGSETTLSQATTTLMARKASELGVPPAVIGKMVTTPASGIAWLDDSDLQAMGVTRVDRQVIAYEPGSALRPGSGNTQLAAAPVMPAYAPKPTEAPQDARPVLSNHPASYAPTTIMPPSLAFQQGALDRTAYGTWFNTLAGDVQLGAAWWAENRSQAVRNHLTCTRPDLSQNFVFGCTLTRTMLTPFDRRRLGEPEYRAGWNSI